MSKTVEFRDSAYGQVIGTVGPIGAAPWVAGWMVTIGGDANETILLPGITVNDVCVVMGNPNTIAGHALSAECAADQINVVWSEDPTAGHYIDYMVFRAV